MTYRGGEMITLKEYVNDAFDNHEQAMRALGLSQATFYRRLKDENWKVIKLSEGKNLEKHIIAKVDNIIKIEVTG